MFVFGVWQGIVFVSQGCHSKLAQAGCIMTTEIYFCTFLEARSLRSRWRQDRAPRLTPRGLLGRTIPFLCQPLRPKAFFSLWFSSVQSLSHVRLFDTPWTATHQTSLSITNSWSLLKLMSIDLFGDENQPSHPLSPSSPPALSLSQHQGHFK